MNQAINFTMTANEFFGLKEYGGQSLSNGDKIVYQVLCSHLFGKAYCFPSINTIASESGITDRSVRRSLARLAKAGLVEIETRIEQGKQKSNKYFVKNILESVGVKSKTESDVIPEDISVTDNEKDSVDSKCQWVTNCPTKKNKYKNKSNDMYSTNTTLEGHSAKTEHPSEEKTVDKVEYNNQDMRFEIIESTEEYMTSLDLDTYQELKKYFFLVLRTKKEFYEINGKNIPKSEIKACMDELSYKDIVVLTQHVMTQRKRFGEGYIKAKFGYYLSLFWNEKHPEDKKCKQTEKQQVQMADIRKNSFSMTDNNTAEDYIYGIEKYQQDNQEDSLDPDMAIYVQRNLERQQTMNQGNCFNQFPQRKYTDEEMDALEKRLLRRTYDAYGISAKELAV